MREAGTGTASPGEGRYLVFCLGGDDYALDAGAVRELLRPPPLTRVPGAPAALSGLANLRGAALPVLDLRRIVTPDREPGTEPSRVVVADAGEPVGLLVDRVVAFAGGRVEAGEGDPAGTRRLMLSSDAGSARLIDLPALVAGAFPRRVRAQGQVSRQASPDVGAGQAERISLVSFVAGGRSYALPLEHVAEVMDLPPEVVPVPGAGEGALGVVALRGGVLPLLGLATLLGYGGITPGAEARVVVARAGSTEVGLVVDSLGPIMRLAPEAVEPVPAALQRGGATAVDAICRIDAGGRLISVLAVDLLLKGATVNAISDRSNVTEGRNTPDGDASTEQFVVFDLAGESYGLPVSAVREVLRVPETMTRLPRSPDLVAGAVDVRGTVLAVIDQRRRFGLPLGEPDARRRIVVLDGGGTAAGLLVDGVSRLLRLPATAVRPTPDLSGEAGAAVDRVATLETGELLPIVDARALLAGTEQAIRAVARRPDGRGTKATGAA